MSEITDRHRECAKELFQGLIDSDDSAFQRACSVFAKHFPEPSREPVAWLCEKEKDCPHITKNKYAAEDFAKCGWTVNPLYK